MLGLSWGLEDRMYRVSRVSSKQGMNVAERIHFVSSPRPSLRDRPGIWEVSQAVVLAYAEL